MFTEKKTRKIRWSSILISVALLVGGVCFSYGESCEDGTAAGKMISAENGMGKETGTEAEGGTEKETEEGAEGLSTVTAGSVITQGGEYRLDSFASEGSVCIKTSEPVTIVGSGLNRGGNDYLTIVCEKENADLTIRELRIDNATEMASGAIRFTGKGNRLTLEGQNMLQQCYNESGGRALIHVPADTELTIDGEGELYMYKHSYQNAAIGGDEGEASGTVIVEGGRLRIMGINGGSLIGSDTAAGDVYIRGGDISLWADSRQTAIGGYDSAPGGNVYVSGGVLSVEGGGVLIGGGLKGSDNGTLHISGGRIRAEDRAKITADIVNGDGEESVWFPLDLSGLVPEAEDCQVTVDGSEYYRGDMHYFSYDIASVSTSASSPETWKERNDSVLVLCLTREDHELTVNGGQFLLKYDEGEDTFRVESQPSEGGDAAGGSGEGGSGGDSGSTGSGDSGNEGGSESGGSGSSTGSGGSSGGSDDGDDSQQAGNGGEENSAGREDGREDENTAISTDVERFRDVERGSWFYDAVRYVCERGLMKGVEEERFAPGQSMTRGMLVTLLQRLDESLSPQMAAAGEDGTSILRFSDVSNGAWYADAVRWACGKGIAVGTGSGRFSPDEYVTREAAVTMLYRCMSQRAAEGSADFPAKLSALPEGAENGTENNEEGSMFAEKPGAAFSFSDANEISSWASDAVEWASGAGIASGDDNGAFRPKDPISRGEIAALIQRLAEYPEDWGMRDFVRI